MGRVVGVQRADLERKQNENAMQASLSHSLVDVSSRCKGPHSVWILPGGPFFP